MRNRGSVGTEYFQQDWNVQQQSKMATILEVGAMIGVLTVLSVIFILALVG